MKAFRALAVFFVASAALLAAGPSPNPVIGFVRSSGEFNLDGSSTRDNATLFNGGVLETTISPSHTTLQDGTRLDLGTASRARVFRDHELLERGTTQVHGVSHYAVIASDLRVFSTEPFRVAITEPGRVRVTALDGYAEVKNARGQLVAMVMPGSPLEFQDAGASAASHITGCLQKVGTHYVVRDSITNTVIEVTGSDLEKYLGKQVDVTGSVVPNGTPIEGAAQVIQVTRVTAGNGKGCPVNIPAATAASGGGTAAGAGAGLSTAAKAGIIVGLAAAGTVGGLAGSGTFTGGAAPATTNGTTP